eukprot:1161775-Pelagomonas_calceolata.AAC.7
MFGCRAAPRRWHTTSSSRSWRLPCCTMILQSSTPCLSARQSCILVPCCSAQMECNEKEQELEAARKRHEELNQAYMDLRWILIWDVGRPGFEAGVDMDVKLVKEGCSDPSLKFACCVQPAGRAGQNQAGPGPSVQVALSSHLKCTASCKVPEYREQGAGASQERLQQLPERDPESRRGRGRGGPGAEGAAGKLTFPTWHVILPSKISASQRSGQSSAPCDNQPTFYIQSVMQCETITVRLCVASML